MRRQPIPSKPSRNILSQLFQTLAKNLSILGIFEKSFLCADAFDLFPQLQWPVVFAEGKPAKFWSPRTDQCPKVSLVVLQVSHCLQTKLNQRLLGYSADPDER